MEPSDGIEEALEGQMRTLLTAAGQMGERLARNREDQLRRAQQRSEQEARELQSRIEAERRAARLELNKVHRSEWWDRATPEDIAYTFQVARGWSNDDPEAVRTEQRISDELRTRYGVDSTHLTGNPEGMRAAIEGARDDVGVSEEEKARAAAEEVEAQQLMKEAEREERRGHHDRSEHLEHESDVTYDSSQERQEFAQYLKDRGIDTDDIATRMRAYDSQARPATEAVTQSSARKAPKARKSTVRTRTAQKYRPGLTR